MSPKIFESTDGCWKYKGKPFFVTTAWYVFHMFLADPKNIGLLDELKAAGFSTADMWFLGAHLWDGKKWNFDRYDEYLAYAARIGLKVHLTIDFTASRFARSTVLEKGWKTVTEQGEEILLDKEGLYRQDDLTMLDAGDPRLREVKKEQRVGDPYVFQNMPLLDQSFLETLKDFLQSIARHFRGNEEVLFYNLMGEVWGFKPYYKQGVGMVEVGYDQITRKAFRDWLAQRFDVKAVASRWGLKGSVKSWKSVEPPVRMKKADYAGQTLSHWDAAWWDWHEFKTSVTNGFMKTVSAWIKEMDDRPIMDEYNTCMPGYYDGWNRDLSWNELLGSGAGLDHLGVQAFEAEYDRQLYYIAISRGASRPPHQLNEIAGQPRDFIMKSKIASDDKELDPRTYLRRFAWLCQAMGCTGMNVWNLKGGAIGMIDDNGKKAETYDTLKDLNAQFARCGERLSGSVPFPPRIGILVLDETTINEPGLAADCARNILLELGQHHYAHEAAVITGHELSSGSVNQYSLVLAPRIPFLTEENAKRLSAYVNQGGFLYLGPESGKYDQIRKKHDGGICAALRACVGARPVAVDRKEHMCHDMAFQADFGVIKAGFNIVGDYTERLEVKPDGARVLATYGWQTALPILTLNRFGKGRCVYCGVAMNKDTRFSTQIVRSLAAEAGIRPHVEVLRANGTVDRDVFIGLRKRDAGYLLIMVESGDRNRRVTVRLNGERLGLAARDHRLEECLTGAAASVGPQSGWAFETGLGPADIRVYDIS